MKKRESIIILMTALLVFTWLVSCTSSPTESSKSKREWTIIGYFDGNNNLDISQAKISWSMQWEMESSERLYDFNFQGQIDSETQMSGTFDALENGSGDDYASGEWTLEFSD